MPQEPTTLKTSAQRPVALDSTNTLAQVLKSLGATDGLTDGLKEAKPEPEKSVWLEPATLRCQSEGAKNIAVSHCDRMTDAQIYWVLQEENGHVRQGTFLLGDLPLNEPACNGYQTRLFDIPFDLPLGYHRLTLYLNQSPEAVDQSWVIMTPASCFRPPALKEDRLWGVVVDLPSLKSTRNWGIGDFSDMVSVVNWSVQHGAGYVQLRPIHAWVRTNQSSHQSTTSTAPSNRLAYNILFIDVEAVEEFKTCHDARNLVYSVPFQKGLDALRQALVLDTDEVMSAKLDVLQLLYQDFLDTHVRQSTQRAREFQTYVEDGGPDRYYYAVFEALQERFLSQGTVSNGWIDWPVAYRDLNNAEVQQFIDSHEEQIQFYLYCHWLAASQVESLGHLAWQKHLPVGLIMDQHTFPHRYGAETWVHPQTYLTGIQLDAGDPINRRDQCVSDLAPYNPVGARHYGYQSWHNILTHLMKPCGGVLLRDLEQLIESNWKRVGSESSDSKAICNPFYEDWLKLVALESVKNQCMVIAGLDWQHFQSPSNQNYAQTFEALGLFGEHLFLSAQGLNRPDDEDPIQPSEYTRQALVSLAGERGLDLWSFWKGRDIQYNKVISQQDTPAARTDDLIKTRVLQRLNILSVLDQAHLLPENLTTDPASVKTVVPDLSTALTRLLSQTPCQLQSIDLIDFIPAQSRQAPFEEDALDALDDLNDLEQDDLLQHDPAWLRWPVALEAILGQEELGPTLSSIQSQRNIKRSSYAVNPDDKYVGVSATVPLASYRIQFNKGFSFDNATQKIPYLAQLGVSHCYASPILCARPGSNHGYDITDHKQFNPEIGTEASFEQFSHALDTHDMKLLVDIVPNHMAIGSHNHWWMDVLENGPASPYADYFDIAWESVKPELRGKVLLPILGMSYGTVLEQGELKLKFTSQTGKLTVHYYDHTLPINPSSYATVLGYRLDVLTARLGSSHVGLQEYLSLLKSFKLLPTTHDQDTDIANQSERHRETRIAQRRLSQLCTDYPDIALFIEENLADFQYHGQDPTRLNRLHLLLEEQCYRLAYWRVALDEINYRRFFDVNELTALRVEDPRVFNATHAYLLKWIEDDKIHGLRIDHPDGLYDPLSYFKQLQMEIDYRLSGQPKDPITAEARLQNKSNLPFYVVVEKIVAHYEHIPDEWPVHGSTGYEFANLVTGLWVYSNHEKSLTKVYYKFIDRNIDYDEAVYDCKKLIMDTSLASELSVLSHQLNRISEQRWDWRDYTLNNLRKALREVVACFPVYRTYFSEDHCSKHDKEYIEWAVSLAKNRSTAIDTTIFDFIERILSLTFDDADDEAFRAEVITFAQKFQQYTGPVMAKSFEDTFFYRYNRLVALNEVGGHPDHFGVTANAFHYRNSERLRWQPNSFLNLSTHDSKRSGDVRARIAVISEIPARWQRAVLNWSTQTERYQSNCDGVIFPDKNTQYLFYQTALGLWPVGKNKPATVEERQSLIERIEQYMLKAVREAKVHTSWINHNQSYEEALSAFIHQSLGESKSNSFMEDFETFLEPIARCGYLNSLAQQVLLLTVPGVPDIYQGHETWAFQLVDPDNRKPVDTAQLEALQQTCAEQTHLDPKWFDTIETTPLKWFITQKLLQLRQSLPDVFRSGAYAALRTQGVRANQVVGFIRHFNNEAVLVLISRFHFDLVSRSPNQLHQPSAWDSTTLKLPKEFQNKTWRSVLDDNEVTIDKQVNVDQLFKHAPFAVFTLS